MKKEKGRGVKCFIGLSIALLFVMLFFGLRPKDFDFSNYVTWVSDHPGIQFKKYGIAYTSPIKDWDSESAAGANGFSIELVLRPESYQEDRFSFILAVCNGKDSSQLLVGQWRPWLIVMNGDDYDHSRKTKRIVAKLTSLLPTRRLVTITTGKGGSSIYLDGRIFSTRGDLKLNIPTGKKTRLLLGNSPDGIHGWRGDILSLAFYSYTLTRHDVAMHFQKWSRNRSFSFARAYKPFLLYLFDEKSGKRVVDHGGRNYDLEIPSEMVILDKKILSFKWEGANLDSGFVKDVLINFIGFIPLGFVLMTTFVKAQGFFRKRHIVITVSLCFGVSLIIEILQAWMPSRSSDFLDLLLNTLGGLSGVMIYRYFVYKHLLRAGTLMKGRGATLNS